MPFTYTQSRFVTKLGIELESTNARFIYDRVSKYGKWK